MRRNVRKPLQEIWTETKPVVGVVHLLPLPGSPGWAGSMPEMLERAVREARIMEDGGLDGILVENFQDAPFYPDAVPPETVAALSLAVAAVMEAVQIPVGLNVLRNDAGAALGVAAATGASFIRVNVHTGSMYTDQGLLQGEAHLTLRKRTALGIEVAILADVLVKHGTPPPGTLLKNAAQDSWHRGLADGLILTGTATGAPVDLEELHGLKDALPPECPIWVGSGATPESVKEMMEVADGLIVGSALQAGGRAGGGVEGSRVSALMAALGRG